MKKTMITLTVLIAAVTLALFACTNGTSSTGGMAVISQDSLVKRGSYLVNSIGCDDCHSPKKMGPAGPEIDLEHRFAGHMANMALGKIDPAVMKEGWLLFTMDLTAAVGPWGVSYAGNISSDATGIGNWSEAQFMNALRHGKLKGMNEGRPLLPPMPWQNFSKLSDTDIKAIYAFLKTTKPVENVVPAPKSLAELK
jgi:Cytochrome c